MFFSIQQEQVASGLVELTSLSVSISSRSSSSSVFRASDGDEPAFR